MTKKKFILILTKSSLFFNYKRMDFKGPSQSDTEKLQHPFTALFIRIFIKKEYSSNEPSYLRTVYTSKKKSL